ncbi:MAG: DinB family protein [Candidatus Hydrogenedentes bacterium]|nr:DinB family protein [Candidatus Hydrogenedentota bacterium]
MSRTKMEVYEKQYAEAFRQTARAAEKVNAEKRLRQAAPNKAHPLWLMGHLALEADTMLNSVLFGAPMTLPDAYGKLFAPHFMGGGPISPDASAYPAWDDVLAEYRRVSSHALERMAASNDTDLAGDIKGVAPRGFEKFIKSFEGLLSFMLQHDAYHRGQLALLAKL